VPAKQLYDELKKRRVLVRYMNYPGFGDGLRISVGSEEEIARLLDELKRLI
jgi:histidinol-phosphate aminotransferase